MTEVVCHLLVSIVDNSRRIGAPLAAAALLSVLVAGVAMAQLAPGSRALASGSHTVRLGVEPIIVLAVSGSPLPLIMDRSLIIGRSVIQDQTTFYNLTSNVDNVHIEVGLDRPMPSGVRLRVSLASRLGRSVGWVDVTRGGREVAAVTGMSRGLENGQTIALQLEVDPRVLDLDLEDRLLTITLIDPVSRRSHTVYQNVQFGVLPRL